MDCSGRNRPALVRVAVDGRGPRAAEWKPDTEPIVGSEVFTVGNPEHLDWTHTRGSISQLRSANARRWQIHVIQTDAALNHGNSGGGLYDKSGTLIGINTWIAGDRATKGSAFSIALRSLLELNPPGLHQPAKELLEKAAKGGPSLGGAGRRLEVGWAERSESHQVFT